MPNQVENSSIKKEIMKKVIEEAVAEANKKLKESETTVSIVKSCEDVDQIELVAKDTQSEFEFEWDAEDIQRAERDLIAETEANVRAALEKKKSEIVVDWVCKGDCAAFVEFQQPQFTFTSAQDGWSTGVGGIGKWMTIICTGTVVVLKGCKVPMKIKK